MIVDVASLKLSDSAREKMIRLAGNLKFDEKKGTLTIITDRCHTRQQNLDYAYYLLTVLYHEANKVEKWEEIKERADNLKVEFEGSTTKTKLVDLLEKMPKSAENSKNLENFGNMWNKYRNSEETVETTREYSRQMKQLLGI